MGGRATVAIAVAIVALLGLRALVARSEGPVSCDRVASPAGSDGAPGTEERPLRTVQRLVESVGPGRTGCLRAGVYLEDVRFRRGGLPGRPLELRSFPGERALLVGRLWVDRRAPWVQVTGLDLDGRSLRGLPSPTINATDVRFEGNDVTSGHTEICFLLGSEAYGRADRAAIVGNRIHDCGVLPPGNQDHGVYVAAATGAVVAHNAIVGNADRGVQLYPDAQGTLVADNLIAGNGEGIIFSGEGGLASSGNVVEGNVIAGSRVRFDVESYFPVAGPEGRGNVARGNCVYGGRLGEIVDPQVGFDAYANVLVGPPRAVPLLLGWRSPAAEACGPLAGPALSAPGAASASASGPPGGPPRGAAAPVDR
jgi:hypothetical protein